MTAQHRTVTGIGEILSESRRYGGLPQPLAARQARPSPQARHAQGGILQQPDLSPLPQRRSGLRLESGCVAHLCPGAAGCDGSNEQRRRFAGRLPGATRQLSASGSDEPAAILSARIMIVRVAAVVAVFSTVSSQMLVFEVSRRSIHEGRM